MSTGWKLDRELRERLLADYPPRYPRTIADHVTYPPPPSGEEPASLPHPVNEARVIGRADDGQGVEAMVVALDGATTRPDGGTWHVTWSLAEGRQARESNDVIAAHGWTAFEGPALRLAPARW